MSGQLRWNDHAVDHTRWGWVGGWGCTTWGVYGKPVSGGWRVEEIFSTGVGWQCGRRCTRTNNIPVRSWGMAGGWRWVETIGRPEWYPQPCPPHHLYTKHCPESLDQLFLTFSSTFPPLSATNRSLISRHHDLCIVVTKSEFLLKVQQVLKCVKHAFLSNIFTEKNKPICQS